MVQVRESKAIGLVELGPEMHAYELEGIALLSKPFTLIWSLTCVTASMGPT